MNITTNEIILNLKKTEIFCDLDNDNLNIISKIIEVVTFSKGDSIIKEFQVGYDMFVLHKGTVEVKKKTFKEDEEYTVLNLDDTHEPFFGELALIDHFSRSATVTALTDLILLKINKNKFTNLCNTNPLIGYKVFYKISAILSGRLRKANKDIITLFDALVHEIKK